MKHIYTLIVTFFLLLNLTTWAQDQNIWAFGVGSGLDFNNMKNGYPTPIRTGINTREGVATICDEEGNLLFYTDGSSIYNKNHQLMPNGSIFNPSVSASTTQGTLIVTKDYDKKYYVFTLESIEITNYQYRQKLFYSIVDMSLDNGLGDIMPEQKAIFIDSGFSEQMTNVVSEDCRRWVVLGKYGNISGRSYSIVFYEITEEGINLQPVVNTIPESHNKVTALGSIIVSHDFKYLVDIRMVPVLYKLDASNGKVYDPIVIDNRELSGHCYYGCFSPDNTKLYFSSEYSPGAYFQVDLSRYDATAIKNSLYNFNLPPLGHGMQLGPDNKIYVSTSQNMSVIHAPNNAGATCQFEYRVPVLPAGNLGLPNTYKENLICHEGRKIDSCFYSSNILSATKKNGKNYLWNTGDTGTTITADTSGIYIVSYLWRSMTVRDTILYGGIKKDLWVGSKNTEGDCFSNEYAQYYLLQDSLADPHYRVYWLKNGTDTFSQKDTVHLLDPGSYTVMIIYPRFNCSQALSFEIKKRYFENLPDIETTYNCYNQSDIASATLSRQLHPSTPYRLVWLDAQRDSIAAGDTAFGLKDGSYYLKISTLYCDTIIPFNIASIKEHVSFEDTLFCQGISYTIENHSSDYFNSFIWNFNNEQIATDKNLIQIWNQAGIHQLQLIGQGEICSDTLNKFITVDSQYTGEFYIFPDSICAGEAVTFNSVKDISTTQFQWKIGKHQMTMHEHENFNHAFAEPGIFPITLKTNYRICPDATFTTSVHVYPSPKVFLGNDSTLCYQGNIITLQNLINSPTHTNYLWSTGDTTRTLQVKAPGIYSLTLTENSLGCTGYGSVEIDKDCFVDIPNAFTPNGDGVNDYFFPRKWLSKGVEKFHLQIFNRWGQLIYETLQSDGLGWDGKWNGTEQPMGVYIYRIEIAFKNGKQEHYEGNVTILR